ncbi:MAG: class I adenylate-forming enzyme family protein [Pseudomonadota bacterium]
MLSVVDTSPAPPCPNPFNLAFHVLAAAQRTPDKIALAVVGPAGADRWSYERLATAVFGVAGAFAAQGFAPGARVLLRLGNTVEFPIAFLGAVAADLVPVPISSQLTTPEVTDVCQQIDPVLIVADPTLPLPATSTPVIDLARLTAWHAHPPVAPVAGDPDRPGYIVFTSGTSGRPRAVEHAHRAIWARQMMRDGWYGLHDDDRVLHAGAFNWTYTLGTGLMDPWAAGATALIPAAGVSASQIPLLLRRHDATIFAAAPGVYRQLLKSPKPLDLPKLRHGLSAGEKMPDALRAAWNDATGTQIYEAIGMSECSTFVSGSPDCPAPEGTLGYAQDGRHIAVLGEDGAPVAREVPGTLAVHRSDPGLTLGYLGHAEETRARYVGEWFLTGDRVAMRQDGAITYLGRDDDMMNAGGYRVSPLEVEAALLTLPDIEEAAAVEVTVKADTTVIAAFYTAQNELDADAISAHMSGLVARYKAPRLFIHVDALPKSANGKLVRRHLRQSFEAQNGQA